MPSMVAGCAPSIVYPPDGVLLPTNPNGIEVHFPLGSPSNTLFEISFTNALTTVRVYTHCTGTTAADGMPMGGGCVFELSPAEWDAIAGTNRDGGFVTVTVRGIGCDGTNVAASASRSLLFARDDLVGVLYYWASMRVGGAVYNSGGVFRYDYGV